MKNPKMVHAGRKAAIVRKLKEQLRVCFSRTSAAAFKAHATRKINAL